MGCWWLRWIVFIHSLLDAFVFFCYWHFHLDYYPAIRKAINFHQSTVDLGCSPQTDVNWALNTLTAQIGIWIKYNSRFSVLGLAIISMFLGMECREPLIRGVNFIFSISGEENDLRIYMRRHDVGGDLKAYSKSEIQHANHLCLNAVGER